LVPAGEADIGGLQISDFGHLMTLIYQWRGFVSRDLSCRMGIDQAFELSRNAKLVIPN
jgi:hypothetical protein